MIYSQPSYRFHLDSSSIARDSALWILQHNYSINKSSRLVMHIRIRIGICRTWFYDFHCSLAARIGSVVCIAAHIRRFKGEFINEAFNWTLQTFLLWNKLDVNRLNRVLEQQWVNKDMPDAWNTLWKVLTDCNCIVRKVLNPEAGKRVLSEYQQIISDLCGRLFLSNSDKRNKIIRYRNSFIEKKPPHHQTTNSFFAGSLNIVAMSQRYVESFLSTCRKFSLHSIPLAISSPAQTMRQSSSQPSTDFLSKTHLFLKSNYKMHFMAPNSLLKFENQPCRRHQTVPTSFYWMNATSTWRAT